MTMESFRLYSALFVTLVILFKSNAFNITGDVTLIGMFKIYESTGSRCGAEVDAESVMVAEAVKWYIEQLNERGILPLTISFEAHETCHVKGRASEVAVNVLNRVLRNEPIIGLIGPELSSETEAVSYILSSVLEERRLAQVGFSATAKGLGDREKYPNFVRVIPNDDVQVDMMIKSMLRLEWNRIAIIYEDDVYGQSMKESFIHQAKEVDICVSLIKNINVANGYSSDYVKSIITDIIVGTRDRPSINGIVYIGFSSAANTMFHHLSNSPYSSVPIVMMSEGAGLDLKTFSDSTGTLFSNAKGTLISSPPQLEVTEFMAHWHNIFTNKTALEIESASNPWLNQLFQAECDNKQCTLWERNQSVFVHYAITAAHALLKSVTEVKKTKCPSQMGLCDDFKQKHIMDALNGISIDFNADFSWRPNSIARYSSSIGESGEIQLSNMEASWQLYNLRSAATDSNQAVFYKVGELLEDSVDVNFNEIRDYLEGDREVVWPEVRKAQCQVSHTCAECSPSEQLEEDVIVEPGDVYVVGIAPVFQKKGVEECGGMRKEDGYQIVESIRLPVLKVNEKSGDYKNYFPGTTIGLIVLNSCMSPAVIQRKIYNLHKNGVMLRNGTVIELQNKILGFVAEYSSTVSIAIADVLTVLGYAQISYTSTSPALSDRVKYPYFMRVVTPDDVQARAMVEIMKKLDVNYAQIIYSVGAYGEDGKNEVKNLAKENSICIINEIAIDDNSNPSALYEQLRKHSHAKIVIAFVYPDFLLSLTTALTNQMDKGEFVFIGSETWARNTAVVAADTNHVLLGSITVSLEIYQDKELRSHIQNIEPKPYRENPWAQMYVQTKRDCYFDLSFDKSQSRSCADNSGPNLFTSLDTYDTAAYVAATSLLVGANTILTEHCGTSVKSLCPYYTIDGLVKEVLNTKHDLDGSGSPMKVFDSNGDGNVGYRINNIQRDPDNPQSLVYEEIGRYPLEGTFTFEKNKLMYPTDDGLVSKCPNEQTCNSCIQQEGADNSKNVIPGEPDSTTTVILGSLLGMFVLTALVMFVCLWRKCRNDRNNDKQPDQLEGYATYRPPCASGPKEKHYKREEVTESKVYLEIGPSVRDDDVRYVTQRTSSETDASLK